MRRAITPPNTIAIAGSAANYPHGLIDPIEKLSALALEAGVGLHVDSCFGGFILPWIAKLGYDVPRFDFRLPGVTSMSCDTHKWGYGLKGASVVLYRNRALRGACTSRSPIGRAACTRRRPSPAAAQKE